MASLTRSFASAKRLIALSQYNCKIIEHRSQSPVREFMLAAWPSIAEGFSTARSRKCFFFMQIKLIFIVRLQKDSFSNRQNKSRKQPDVVLEPVFYFSGNVKRRGNKTVARVRCSSPPAQRPFHLNSSSIFLQKVTAR